MKRLQSLLCLGFFSGGLVLLGGCDRRAKINVDQSSQIYELVKKVMKPEQSAAREDAFAEMEKMILAKLPAGSDLSQVKVHIENNFAQFNFKPNRIGSPLHAMPFVVDDQGKLAKKGHYESDDSDVCYDVHLWFENDYGPIAHYRVRKNKFFGVDIWAPMPSSL